MTRSTEFLRPVRRSFSAAAGAIAISMVAGAVPVRAECLPSVSYYNYARLRAASDPLVVYLCEYGDGTSCIGSAPVPDTAWTVSYEAENAGSPGVLGGRASILLGGDDSLGPFPSFASVGARAGFMEEWVISGGTGEGTLTLTFEIDGSRSESTGTSGRPQVQAVPSPDGVPDWANQIVASLVYTDTGAVAELDLPIVFDVPSCWQIDFYALAQIFQWIVAGQAAAAEYLHTAYLSSMLVLDSEGNPVESAVIESASGIHYSETGVVVLRDGFEAGDVSGWTSSTGYVP